MARAIIAWGYGSLLASRASLLAAGSWKLEAGSWPRCSSLWEQPIKQIIPTSEEREAGNENRKARNEER